uniref:Uncharacterized protein n=1 Tax=Panagrolaimus sp. ES5 TaxID=591445 RepID=A0AC34G074_9BILA
MNCFKIIFFLVIFCVQLLFLDPTIAAKLGRNNENDSILDGNDKIDKQRPLFTDALLADEKAEGIQEEDDLRLRGNGEINISLT